MTTFNPPLNKSIPVELAIIDSALLKGRLVLLQDLSENGINPHTLVGGIEPLTYLHQFDLLSVDFLEVFFNGFLTNKDKGLLLGLNAKSYLNFGLLDEHLRHVRMACQKYNRWAFVVLRGFDHPRTEYQPDIVYRIEHDNPAQVKVIKNRLQGADDV